MRSAPTNINVFIDGPQPENAVNHGGVAGQNFIRQPFPSWPCRNSASIRRTSRRNTNRPDPHHQRGDEDRGTSFHGDIFGEWQPKAFIGIPYFDRPARRTTARRPKADYDRKQYGRDLAVRSSRTCCTSTARSRRPIRSCRRCDQPLTTRNVDGVAVPNVPQAIASQFNGSYPQSFKQRLYFGKLTLFAAKRTRSTLARSCAARAIWLTSRNVGPPSHGRFLTSNNDTTSWNGPTAARASSTSSPARTRRCSTAPARQQRPEIILVAGTASGPVGVGASLDTRRNWRRLVPTVRRSEELDDQGQRHLLR